MQEREGPSTTASWSTSTAGPTSTTPNQCHEVQREEGVEQHEQGLHQGHLWQVQAKVGGLHRGPGQCLQEMNVPGPPTPMYDLCKNNFASAESFSLCIFMPLNSKMKFCYFFKWSKNNKIGCVLTAISCSTTYISDIFLFRLMFVLSSSMFGPL